MWRWVNRLVKGRPEYLEELQLAYEEQMVQWHEDLKNERDYYAMRNLLSAAEAVEHLGYEVRIKIFKKGEAKWTDK